MKTFTFSIICLLLSTNLFSQNNIIPINGLVLHLDAANYKPYQSYQSGPNRTTISSGLNWDDISGNNNNGLLNNKFQQKVSDNFGIPSLYFNDPSDFVTIKNTPNLNPTEGITLIVWTKLNDLIQNQNLISKGYYTVQFPYIQYSLKMSDFPPYNTPQFNLSLNNQLITLQSKTVLAENIWYMIVCTYDKNSMRLFVNNIQDLVVTNQNNNIDSYSTDLEIGRWPTGQSQNFKGNINSVYIYNRALSKIEINDIWNITKTKFGYQGGLTPQNNIKNNTELIEDLTKKNNLSEQEKKQLDSSLKIQNQLAQQMLTAPEIFKGISKIKLPDGRVYEGEFTYFNNNNGTIDSSTIKRNGNGKQYGINGNLLLEGLFINNFLSKGKVYDNSGSLLSEGIYKWNSPSRTYILDGGYGKEYLFGTYLWIEGFYKNGKLDGKGKMYYSKTNSQGKPVNGGIKYEGDFLDGNADGFGNYYDESGKLVYSGYFKDGKTLTSTESNQVESSSNTNSNPTSSNESTNSQSQSSTSSNESFKKWYNASIAENKNLESFLKLLASSSPRTSSTSNSKSQSSKTNQYGKCIECSGTGKCRECSKTFSVSYYDDRVNSFKNRNESRLGYVICGTCRGAGVTYKRSDYPNYGKWQVEKKCYVSSCRDGWVPCNTCNSNGNSKELGVCKRCKGSGSK
ncbi:LamG-like jellyroll fold domain-containing protein [Aquirufa nivalisilvae]|uniref:LamG-like jellyroll fold domain-containing protein n=1 Tax=Aquirufa nivalisilvae TaxID=2516557 RepID=UPI0022A8E122|nr:LamG-like jellyroll fold domain-containing protein [Aquirufa nivalisilvae]MCZ2481283.1 hypothetical protein [Aquirufa nivalisilvae]